MLRTSERIIDTTVHDPHVTPIVKCLEANGLKKWTMMYESVERGGIKEGFLEISFNIVDAGAFEKFKKERDIEDLFHKEEGDPEGKVRFRTPTWTARTNVDGEVHEAILDTYEEVAEWIGVEKLLY
jgi:hypothetical protein